MTNTANNNGWRPYDLDYYAQELVLEFRNTKDVLNESHKMRMTIAYGLERFWGEHLRLKNDKDKDKKKKSEYWLAVWKKLHEILLDAGVVLPNDSVESSEQDAKKRKKEETEKIKTMAKRIWDMDLAEQRIALMVLTQFCDSLVWWTQRYKEEKED